MKRLLCLGLSVAMLLGMTACGSKNEDKLPKFSETELTKAQEYVYAAMDISAWDVSEVDAIVVAYLGDKEGMDAGTTAAEDTDAKKDWSPVVFLLGGENKEVVYYRSLKAIADLDASAADQMTEYKAALETANSYDVYLRQLEIYENSLEAIEQIMSSSDKDEREYLKERTELVDNHLANYSNLYKTYVQCLVNLSNFEADNADALASYEAEVAAIKEEAGDGYEDSVEYIKVQLKYKEMLESHEGFKKAIPLAKTDLDAMKSEYDAALSELETKEQERLDAHTILQEKNAFFEYACNAAADHHLASILTKTLINTLMTALVRRVTAAMICQKKEKVSLII